MVIIFPAHEAVIPIGKPVATPIPVAPVVVLVIAVIAVLIHIVGVLDAGVTVLLGFTIILPVAYTVLQPPVNRIL